MDSKRSLIAMAVTGAEIIPEAQDMRMSELTQLFNRFNALARVDGTEKAVFNLITTTFYAGYALGREHKPERTITA